MVRPAWSLWSVAWVRVGNLNQLEAVGMLVAVQQNMLEPEEEEG